MFADKWYVEMLDQYAQAGSLAEEIIGSVRTVKAFASETILGDRFDQLTKRARRKGQLAAGSDGIGFPLISKSSRTRCKVQCSGKLMISVDRMVNLCVCILLRRSSRFVGHRFLGRRHNRHFLHHDCRFRAGHDIGSVASYGQSNFGSFETI